MLSYLHMKILGVDYGTKKIGLALGIGDLIKPLMILPNKPNHQLQSQALQKIYEIIRQEKIQKVVIGNPYLDKFFSKESKNIVTFVNLLKTQLTKDNVEVIEVDEYRTNDVSQNEMSKIGIKKKDIKNDDAFSAGVLIRRYLEEGVT